MDPCLAEAGGALGAGTDVSAPARQPIRRLDPDTIGRIAAGEVVERPASVVKELLENSADAGARSVEVRLLRGGLEEIVVEDDGWGIPAAELPLAVERHATSKLAPGEPLEGVRSLGFRGEALAAIGSVSRLVVLSRVPETDVAHGVELAGGTLLRTFEAGRAPGTTVTVRELFADVPARRKFLKSAASEQLEVTATVDRAYLARPSVALALTGNGSDLARYPATRDLRSAAGHVLGSEFLEHAFPVQARSEGVGLTGWLGRPPLSRSTLAGLHLAVNGRSVASRPLAQAVRVAFSEYLPRARAPVGVLHLELDPSLVDVNVHPAKREVRFAREPELLELVRHTVRAALIGAPQEAATPMGGALAPAGSDPSGPRAEPFGVETGAISAVFAPAVRQRLLSSGSTARTVAASPRHPALELLGCLGQLYWVAATGEDLVLIDQHAASERVLYDELMRRGRLAQQELLVPVRLALSPRQSAALAAEAETVGRSGFSVAPFGEGAWRVHAVPSYRGRRAPVEELPHLLDELAEGGRPSLPDGLRERASASIACHAAVRGGDTISAEEMGRLLEELYALPELAYSCPHGRPILFRVPRSRLDRWFGRSGA